MPQMMPLYWEILFFSTMMLIFTLMMKIFFMEVTTNKKDRSICQNVVSVNKVNWKW